MRDQRLRLPRRICGMMVVGPPLAARCLAVGSTYVRVAAAPAALKTRPVAMKRNHRKK